jgi:hypothetical protein
MSGANSNLQDAYLKGFQIGLMQKQNQRDEQMRSLLGQNYQSPTSDVGTAPNPSGMPPSPGGLNMPKFSEQAYRAGLGPEAESFQMNDLAKRAQAGNLDAQMQLRQQQVRDSQQAALSQIYAGILKNPTDINVQTAGAMYTSQTGQDHRPLTQQLLAMSPADRQQAIATMALAHPKGEGILSKLYPSVDTKTTGFNGGQQVETTTKQPMAGVFGNTAPRQAPAATASGQAGGVHGDEFLSTLDGQTSAQVKALAEGRMQFPQGFALKSPYWQNMLNMVAQYDPSFDAVNYNARAGTRKDFTSGKSAENVTALNTAIAHLQTLSNNFKQLDNSDFPAYNSAANFLGRQFGNPEIQKNVAATGTTAEAVAHELAKVFRSTGMSEGEINAWKQKINTNATPAEQQAIIDGAIELMNGRLEALADRYNKGLGTTSDGLELLSPKSREAITNLRGGPTTSNAKIAPTYRRGQVIKLKNGRSAVITDVNPDGSYEVR